MPATAGSGGVRLAGARRSSSRAELSRAGCARTGPVGRPARRPAADPGSSAEDAVQVEPETVGDALRVEQPGAASADDQTRPDTDRSSVRLALPPAATPRRSSRTNSTPGRPAVDSGSSWSPVQVPGHVDHGQVVAARYRPQHGPQRLRPPVSSRRRITVGPSTAPRPRPRRAAARPKSPRWPRARASRGQRHPSSRSAPTSRSIPPPPAISVDEHAASP